MGRFFPRPLERRSSPGGAGGLPLHRDVLEVPGGQLCLYRDWGEALPRARGALAAHVCYAVQQRPAGLCDALFRALPFVAPEEDVLVGLPDTVWFPEDGFCRLARGLSFLLFRVERP